MTTNNSDPGELIERWRNATNPYWQRPIAVIEAGEALASALEQQVARCKELEAELALRPWRAEHDDTM